jgi:hypothetical protein
MNDETSRNASEKVQRWLHGSYNGSNNDIHSTVRSQRPGSMVAGIPQNFVSVGDKTHLNDVSKLLAQTFRSSLVM